MSLKTSLPEILTTEDLAKLTNLSLCTIRRYTGNREEFGHLLPPWFKLPGKRRLSWKKEDVLKWVKAGEDAKPVPKKSRNKPVKSADVQANTSNASGCRDEIV